MGLKKEGKETLIEGLRCEDKDYFYYVGNVKYDAKTNTPVNGSQGK